MRVETMVGVEVEVVIKNLSPSRRDLVVEQLRSPPLLQLSKNLHFFTQPMQRDNGSFGAEDALFFSKVESQPSSPGRTLTPMPKNASM